MIKWFKSLSRQEKTMAVIIVILVVLIIVRWDFVKKEAGGAIKDRVEIIKGNTGEPINSAFMQPDSTKETTAR